jgi:hypothetical protein
LRRHDDGFASVTFARSKKWSRPDGANDTQRVVTKKVWQRGKGMINERQKQLTLISILMSANQADQIPELSMEMFDIAEQLSKEWEIDLSFAAETVGTAVQK